jgi:hypothetical protein
MTNKTKRMAQARVERAPTLFFVWIDHIECGCTPCASGPYFASNLTCISIPWFKELCRNRKSKRNVYSRYMAQLVAQARVKRAPTLFFFKQRKRMWVHTMCFWAFFHFQSPFVSEHSFDRKNGDKRNKNAAIQWPKIESNELPLDLLCQRRSFNVGVPNASGPCFGSNSTCASTSWFADYAGTEKVKENFLCMAQARVERAPTVFYFGQQHWMWVHLMLLGLVLL